MKIIAFILLSILIFFTLVGCSIFGNSNSTEILEPDYKPILFNSLADLEAEKKTRTSPSYNEFDPYDLKNLDVCYQFSDLPDNIIFKQYSLRDSYITTDYIYQYDDNEYLSKFLDSGYTKDELLTISLTAHRDMGEKEFNEFINREPRSGELIELGGLSKVDYKKATLNGAVMVKAYAFVVMEQFFFMEVPGNMSDELVAKLIRNIQKVKIE